MDPALPPFFTIVQEFMAGRLSVQDAAPRLVAALDKAGGPVNLPISPKMRELMAEVHRIQTGQAPPSRPPFAPDPKRHDGGNLGLLAGTTDSFWRSLRKLDGPATLTCSYHAATESVARGIAEWLRTCGHAVTIESPLEADDDDWVVAGRSPARSWTRELVAEWVATLRSAPLEGAASIMGVAVVDE